MTPAGDPDVIRGATMDAHPSRHTLLVDQRYETLRTPNATSAHNNRGLPGDPGPGFTALGGPCEGFHVTPE